MKGECVLHTGRLTRDGYGPHRRAWVRARGPIPAGMTVDHLCGQRACQNVEHMELVSQEVNFRRSVERRVQREPVCPRCGGEWTKDARGTRHCAECVAERRREAREGGFE